MNPTSLSEESKSRLYEANETEIKLQDDSSSFSNKKGTISTDAGNNPSNQRDRSMALNSEGLEVDYFFLFHFINSFCLFHFEWWCRFFFKAVFK